MGANWRTTTLGLCQIVMALLGGIVIPLLSNQGVDIPSVLSEQNILLLIGVLGGIKGLVTRDAKVSSEASGAPVPPAKAVTPEVEAQIAARLGK